ncbi:MAG: Fe-S cluster assembly ATPase SufC [Anaerolineae bacterium]|nr:Fe-S cluster assembly ATPase SufC [Anaerolineae bacterium]MCB9142570.1 Fe-S cluster assembly ATPase SufC [Anaerolineales bacterium]MCB0228332.1 Fe-S cluster assembly ATPase SufC [Anaerolineae bacterium]MCB0234916.1 Fe-S cluster assembly ATPase SufC [Anaerolineae bacterium]MCB0239392.1 Fe-S cluster assembly ATPase SufC [Anaerolineae bacterium]
MTSELVIQNLHVAVNDGEKEVLKGVNLTVRQGEIHALMGPNGSGKSTLSYAIMGHPHYTVTEGDILLDGESVLDMEPNERARKGLFLAFQYPVAVPGVSMANFLRTAVSNMRGFTDKPADGDGRQGVIGSNLMPMRDFRRELLDKMDEFHVDRDFAKRYLNEGFSGGEKKRVEILQMAMLQPKIAIMDETDSGLDIDALRVVSDGVNKLAGPNLGILLITHYQRILNYVQPHFVHVFYNGRIVKSGGIEVAHELEAQGYQSVRDEFGEPELVAA